MATYGVILGSAVRTARVAWTSISMDLATLKEKDKWESVFPGLLQLC